MTLEVSWDCCGRVLLAGLIMYSLIYSFIKSFIWHIFILHPFILQVSSYALRWKQRSISGYWSYPQRMDSYWNFGICEGTDDRREMGCVKSGGVSNRQLFWHKICRNQHHTSGSSLPTYLWIFLVTVLSKEKYQVQVDILNSSFFSRNMYFVSKCVYCFT